ncbi:hypothetical protein EON62_06120 [archaeon]|nr:MAG: hypothetical protein EON62_06120 [archaeon]
MCVCFDVLLSAPAPSAVVPSCVAPVLILPASYYHLNSYAPPALNKHVYTRARAAPARSL